jgi:hypothetical protein
VIEEVSIGLAHWHIGIFNLINSHLSDSDSLYYAVPTRMDAVPGVKQKLFSSLVPQLENRLQPPPQPPLAQKPTLLVADRQLVPGASRQVAPPLYTVQGPPQRSSILLEQYVTIVSKALRLERSERSPRGLPWKVTLESVLASQCLNCSIVIKLPCQEK